jgi:hypothetical protein
MQATSRARSLRCFSGIVDAGTLVSGLNFLFCCLSKKHNVGGGIVQPSMLRACAYSLERLPLCRRQARDGHPPDGAFGGRGKARDAHPPLS